MHMRVTVVCLFVCLLACLVVTNLLPSYDVFATIERTSQFVLNSNGFQLMDFAKKLSFLSYSLFFILALPSQPFSSSQYRKLESCPLRILMCISLLMAQGYTCESI